MPALTLTAVGRYSVLSSYPPRNFPVLHGSSVALDDSHNRAVPSNVVIVVSGFYIEPTKVQTDPFWFVIFVLFIGTHLVTNRPEPIGLSPFVMMYLSVGNITCPNRKPGEPTILPLVTLVSHLQPLWRDFTKGGVPTRVFCLLQLKKVE